MRVIHIVTCRCYAGSNISVKIVAGGGNMINGLIKVYNWTYLISPPATINWSPNHGTSSCDYAHDSPSSAFEYSFPFLAQRNR